MFDLTIENQYGQRVELTHSPLWTVAEIDGLDPPDATINITKNAGMDGSVFNSATADNRQIIITLAINGEAEPNRISLYRYIKTKQKVRIYYRNGLRNVYIDGYVKNFTIAFFDKKEVAQITIICTDPYFRAAESSEYDLSSQTRGFEFPFSIAVGDPIPFSEIIEVLDVDVYNSGDVETGAVIRLIARGNVVNPNIYLDDGRHFRLIYTMTEGQQIVISTIRKQKRVTLYKTDGTNQSLIGKIENGSTWLTFGPSDNYVSTGASSGAYNLDALVELTSLYEGV